MNPRCTALALALLMAAAQADSSTSSATSLASKSVGSLSDSVSQSSQSSSGKAEVDAGRYVVVQLQALAQEPGKQRLALRAEQADTVALHLNLPAELVAAQGLREGDLLQITPRAYGLAIARADAAEPFFLALQAPQALHSRKL